MLFPIVYHTSYIQCKQEKASRDGGKSRTKVRSIQPRANMTLKKICYRNNISGVLSSAKSERADGDVWREAVCSGFSGVSRYRLLPPARLHPRGRRHFRLLHSVLSSPQRTRTMPTHVFMSNIIGLHARIRVMSFEIEVDPSPCLVFLLVKSFSGHGYRTRRSRSRSRHSSSNVSFVNETNEFFSNH